MNEPVTAPTYSIPTGPAPKTAKIVPLAIVGILALAVAAGYVYFSHMQDSAFRGTRYLAGSFEERALYELNWFGDAKEVSLPVAGKVVDYARSNGVEAAVILSDVGQQVYLIDAKASRVIAGGEGIRSSLSISPDGTRVAYAERARKGADASPFSFYDPASWEIHVVTVGSGENVDIGTGYAPQLFTRDGVSYVLYTTDAGVRIRNLSSSAEQELALELGAFRGMFPSIVAEDGLTVALPTPGGFYMLYALTHEGGVFALNEGRQAPEGATIIAFNGPELVSLTRSADSAQFTRSNLSSSEEATARKSAPVLSITKLIP